MKYKNTIIKGTLILTITGIMTKIIGFYYRIFLNNKIGAEGVGIYHLIFPVFIMCFSFCCVGIQTSLSRIVAIEKNNIKNAEMVLYIALATSGILAILMTFLCNYNAEYIACNFINDKGCTPLIKILSYSFVPASIHSCITGYYYGMKKTIVPSISNLSEQIIRVVGVYFIFEIVSKNQLELEKFEKISIAVWGLFIGETASATVSLSAFLGKKAFSRRTNELPNVSLSKTIQLFKNLFNQAIPLTLNRLCTTFLQSTEAILFPIALCKSGLEKSDALALFGIFTGMALPLIMFPSALTNSLSVLLVSEVASFDGEKNKSHIAKTIQYTMGFTLFLGIFCTGYFFENGHQAGIFLFNSETVGEYILSLSFLCPFLYLSSTLGSILHGLGKTGTYFIFNISTLIFRILFLWFVTPQIGMNAYIFGVLLSQIILTVLIVICLHKNIRFTFNISKWLFLSVKCCVYAYILITITNIFLDKVNLNSPILTFSINSVIYCLPFIRELGKFKSRT